MSKGRVTRKKKSKTLRPAGLLLGAIMAAGVAWNLKSGLTPEQMAGTLARSLRSLRSLALSHISSVSK